ncbi:DUF2190 domain-containing protein [Rhodococcus sp. 06-418-1B]|nr:capsid cement protein [Rhodococcus sp. 06-418-1B]OZC76368.1 DUF2190 domain-containing protein [Rhodococcus sp. 06-418-1B]
MSIDIDVYGPGRDISAQATAAVIGGRAVAISGNRVAEGNLAVAPASAGGRIFGIAKHDAAVGGLVSVARGNARVVRIRAGGAIAANAEVEVGAAGAVVTKTSGVAIGYAVTGAANGTDAQISLY